MAFTPADALTGSFVVTHKGRIIGERYGDGLTMHTPLESWSMGKSLTATLMGVLIQQGVYDLYESAPIPEWQTAGDPRQQIRIADILRMSSGLRFRGVADPGLDPALGYPDHLYVYTGSINSFEWAATRPQQWPPNTIGRYRNSDPVLTNYLVRLGVEGRGGEYLSFPQRNLFDKLGIDGMVLETDPYGNYLLQGYELAPARDWARLGNLYFQDGVWNGERILPEGYVDFVSRSHPPGRMTVDRSMADSSGSMGREHFLSPAMRTTCRAQAGKTRLSFHHTTLSWCAKGTIAVRERAGRHSSCASLVDGSHSSELNTRITVTVYHRRRVVVPWACHHLGTVDGRLHRPQ
ncbi:MAG: hypothetical protein CM1200mP25_5240 [Acidobacteriota bacterium]|nr:MAG: hypothetical protein CM1200mP25_5240 [Acidobacteriota bacterium]